MWLSKVRNTGPKNSYLAAAAAGPVEAVAPAVSAAKSAHKAAGKHLHDLNYALESKVKCPSSELTASTEMQQSQQLLFHLRAAIAFNAEVEQIQA